LSSEPTKKLEADDIIEDEGNNKDSANDTKTKKKSDFDNYDDNDYSFGDRRKDKGEEIVLDKERLIDMIYNLDNKLSGTIKDVSNAVNKLQQTVNNGIKHKTDRNSKSISNLGVKVNDIHTIVSEIKGKEEGKKILRNKLGWYLAAISTILGIGVTILSYLDKLPF